MAMNRKKILFEIKRGGLIGIRGARYVRKQTFAKIVGWRASANTSLRRRSGLAAGRIQDRYGALARLPRRVLGGLHPVRSQLRNRSQSDPHRVLYDRIWWRPRGVRQLRAMVAATNEALARWELRSDQRQPPHFIYNPNPRTQNAPLHCWYEVRFDYNAYEQLAMKLVYVTEHPEFLWDGNTEQELGYWVASTPWMLGIKSWQAQRRLYVHSRRHSMMKDMTR